jgi:uncharacterized protein (TIGR03435 family)
MAEAMPFRSCLGNLFAHRSTSRRESFDDNVGGISSLHQAIAEDALVAPIQPVTVPLMIRQTVIAALMLAASGIVAQSPAPRPKFDVFEVATIKLVDSDAKTGRFIKMEGLHRFIGKDYTLKLLIAAAYSLNPRTISGGPGWTESEHYDILAETPGEVRPTHDEQMAMLRKLLAERFKLTFHREQKEFSIYALEVAKGGPKLKVSTASSEEPAALISTVYPQHILLPARNTTMGEFTSMMQRAILDRPVVDRTGLTGKYDFDLEWAPDETQLNGDVTGAPAESPAAPLFSAIQQQLGLRLEATRGPVDAFVVDKAERPTEN